MRRQIDVVVSQGHAINDAIRQTGVSEVASCSLSYPTAY
jgi:hypothetical protein